MGKYSGLSGWLQSAFFLKKNISFTTIRATIVAFRPQRVKGTENPTYVWRLHHIIIKYSNKMFKLNFQK